MLKQSYLLLSGNLEPTGGMLGKAEAKGVPVILVADDTLTTLEKVDEVFGKARIRGEAEIAKVKVKNLQSGFWILTD